MLEILTVFGAVIHVDPNSADQMNMLPVAVVAFGGVVSQMELTDHVE